MNDTIAAIATPFGEGGIGIIRMSGQESTEILRAVFRATSKEELVPRMMTYGHIVDPDTLETVDEVLCVYMKAPHSYTAEDVVEIHCHGGMVPLRRTLSLLLRKGARPADRGEFTKRAFLNGRLDLAQAEAVMDLISAKADRSFDVAMQQLEGSLSATIREIRAKLVDVLVDLTVNIDYPDEDIEEITYSKLEEHLSIIRDQVATLLKRSDTGRILREGLRIAIIGKPNVGKSSLMNALLKESRAIVTDIPGTTRDTIEESMSISGIPVVLTDTAGIRETEDQIEAIGIERSKKSVNQADYVIFMLDASRALDDEDRFIAESLDPKRTIVLLNKTDLDQVIGEKEVSEITSACVIPTAIQTGIGLELLEEEIQRRVYDSREAREESVLVTSVRHKNLLERSMNSITDALTITAMQEPLEIIEIDVNSAYESLGEIIGEAVGDDILEEVFSRFCLGK